MPHSSHPCPTQNKHISLLQIILTQSRRQKHLSPLCPLCNIHTHDTHHLFNCTHIRTTLSPLDLWSDCTAGKMDGEAGWWTTSGNIGLPPLARVMGVGRQQQRQCWCGGWVRCGCDVCRACVWYTWFRYCV